MYEYDPDSTKTKIIKLGKFFINQTQKKAKYKVGFQEK